MVCWGGGAGGDTLHSEIQAVLGVYLGKNTKCKFYDQPLTQGNALDEIGVLIRHALHSRVKDFFKWLRAG